jgi:hypothetical protein
MRWFFSRFFFGTDVADKTDEGGGETELMSGRGIELGWEKSDLSPILFSAR